MLPSLVGYPQYYPQALKLFGFWVITLIGNAGSELGLMEEFICINREVSVYKATRPMLLIPIFFRPELVLSSVSLGAQGRSLSR